MRWSALQGVKVPAIRQFAQGCGEPEEYDPRERSRGQLDTLAHPPH